MEMTADVSLQQIEAAVLRLPSEQRKQVLLFVEFLEYLVQQQQRADGSDDASLWNAVLAHQTYRQSRKDEQPEVFESREAFLRATEEM